MQTNLNMRSEYSRHLKLLDGVHFASILDYEITTAFQPIVNKKEQLIGYEALLRPFHNNQACTACEFLDIIRKHKKIDFFDRLIRALHYRNFSLLIDKSPHLFLNFEYESLTDMNHTASCQSLLLKRQKDLGIDNLITVTEILEHEVESEHWLMMISQWRRKNHGIIIALDDIVDCPHVWERITMIQPDIVKIDKSMLSCDNYLDFVKRLKAYDLTILQEGIETNTQKQLAKSAGADLFQGYNIGYPTLIKDMNHLPQHPATSNTLNTAFNLNFD